MAIERPDAIGSAAGIAVCRHFWDAGPSVPVCRRGRAAFRVRKSSLVGEQNVKMVEALGGQRPGPFDDERLFAAWAHQNRVVVDDDS
jgi:hypothetical protein